MCAVLYPWYLLLTIMLMMYYYSDVKNVSFAATTSRTQSKTNYQLVLDIAASVGLGNG